MPPDVKTVSMWDVGSYKPSVATVDRNAFYFDEATCLHCVLQFSLAGGRVSRIAVTLHRDHFSLAQHDVTAAELQAGFSVKGSPFNAPETLVEGPDASIWVLDRLGNRIAVIAADKSIRDIELPTPFADAGDIIATSQFVWVSERRLARIVRFSLDGSYKEYQLKSLIGLGDLKITSGHGDRVYFIYQREVGMVDGLASTPQYFSFSPVAIFSGIAVGSDGELWISGLPSWEPRTRSFLASLNSSGEWQRFTVGDAATQIEPARDGLWLNRSEDDYLSFFTWNGNEHVFKMPVERLHPILYAVGTSNDAWFSDRYGNVVGHATSVNTVSATYTDFGPAEISDMRLDASGNLWIAQPGNHVIDEMGKSLYLPPRGVSPKYLLFDSSGKLWYSDPGADVVGVVTKSGPARCYAFRLSRVRNCAFDHADIVR